VVHRAEDVTTLFPKLLLEIMATFLSFVGAGTGEATLNLEKTGFQEI
jgi:hypothetical protein